MTNPNFSHRIICNPVQSAKNYLCPVLLTMAVFLVYFPILGNDFLYFWDDQWMVMNRYTEGGFNLHNIKAIFTEFYNGQYGPFTELHYLILYTVFGYNPLPFHLASLLFHLGSACLVYFCFRLLLSIDTQIKPGNNIKAISFFTALIFAVHPFNVEPVAWISASKVIIYGFYYWAATYCFLLYLKKGKMIHCISALLFFVFSFFGKEQAVIFPAWLALIYWVAGYSFKSKKVWFTLLPFIALSLLFGAVTLLSQSAHGEGVLSSAQEYPLHQRMVYGCYALLEYFFKLFCPVKLSYSYPYPSLMGEPLPRWLLVYPLLITVLTASFWKWTARRKALVFGLLFFLVHIAFALHLIPLSRFVVVADRYVYISSIGVCFILSYFAVQLFMKTKGKAKKILPVCAAGYLLYLGVYANIRSRVWHDTDSLKKEIRELLRERDDYEGNKVLINK